MASTGRRSNYITLILLHQEHFRHPTSLTLNTWQEYSQTTKTTLSLKSNPLTQFPLQPSTVVSIMTSIQAPPSSSDKAHKDLSSQKNQTPKSTVMPRSPQEDISAGYVPTDADNSASSPENQAIFQQIPNSSSILVEALPNATNVNPRLDTLPCRVLSCSFVFKGKFPYGYLWRHLGRPGAHGLTGDERTAWENLHKIEHDRLLVTRITPAQRRREANRAKVRKRLRTAEFEQRAKNMGITEEALVAQKVVIWEGMRAAEKHGRDIEVCALYSALFWGP
ncbi:hypothetical protein B9Z19DRAFT_1061048 [Tuber borchii]|uniref:Uncharacterized protein n=1 Tax=Tuber borchii TaxID=42251 RepID=A0A2T7A6J1_TUBBO|nr:hypothetical protein B9Z19DRAFT_1061048 [Tuber borchii]